MVCGIFFYESGTDEHSGNVGRMNFRESIRAILDSYELNKARLNFDEKIVLKTILLFQAIDQETRGSIELFKPTEKNLELAFTGVSEMENGRAITIANELVRKNILFKKPATNKEDAAFAIQAMSGDSIEIERLKKTIAESVRTADLVLSAGLIDTIDLTAAQRERYDLQPVSVDNFTQTINRLTNEGETYKIKVVVCFARNEEERNKIQNYLSANIGNERYCRLVFIDASSNLINSEIFKRWVENSASEKYWRGKDNALADQMKQNADDCLKAWKNSVAQGSFVYYSAVKNPDDSRRKISCQNATQLKDELRDNVRRLFQYSFDDASITDTLFQLSQQKNMAEAGITHKESSMLKTNAIKVLGDAWNISGNYWEILPDISISRLKIELDALIKTEIENNVRISFDEIFKFLLERGFMPVNIYAFLTGFLLREYAGDPYRYSAGVDGNLGGAMSASKLAECIGESVRLAHNGSTRNSRPKYLEIMSQNQRQFMTFAAEIFNVAEDVSVEQCAQKLRLKLKNLGYPLWCYVDAVEDKQKNFMQLLTEIANTKLAVSISALAERAGQILTNNPETFSDLKNFMTAQKGSEIFTDFLRNFESGIIFELAQKIGIENPAEECRQRVTSGDGIWLHDKSTAEEDLKKFIVDYKIVAESRKFGINGKSLSACVENWATHCRFNLKIPYDVIGDYYPTVRNFSTALKEITEHGEIPQGKREFFLSQLTGNAENIHRALSDAVKILSEKYSYQLDGLNDEERAELYDSLPNSSFTDSQGKYYKSVDEAANKIRSRQQKSKLWELWKEVAGNISPREWSKIHRTPIVVMVPKSEQDAAKKVFDTVMAPSPSEIEMKFALEYLENHRAYFSELNDEMKIEAAFRREIIGELSVILDDNNEVRNQLESKNLGDAYGWYRDSRVKELLEEFAKNKYYNGGFYEKVIERVMKMPAEVAKKLLIELLDRNYEVGLKILRES